MLTVDVDVLDPAFAPGTGTPEPGGLTPTELLWACRPIGQPARPGRRGRGRGAARRAVGWPTSPRWSADRVVREILTGVALRRRAAREEGVWRA